jgi:hypothetical protein
MDLNLKYERAPGAPCPPGGGRQRLLTELEGDVLFMD